ncbi:hypothetical protein D3C74_22040 [compost metagenome]
MSSKSSIPDIRKTVQLKAPIERVWRAVATSEGIAAWWMPNTFEPILGYEFILHAGPFGESPCKVTDIDPPTRLEIAWGKDWQLIFELRAMNKHTTEFTLIHAGWDEETVTEFGQPHAIVRDRMNGGWEGIVHEKLVRYVEG